jgi:hypothetical protein
MAAKKTTKKKYSKKTAGPRKAPRRAAKAAAKTAKKPPSRAAKASSKAKGKLAKAKAVKKPVARAKTSPPAKPKRASAAPKARATSNGVHRRDRAGHLDPRYAKELRAKSREGKESSDDRAFVGNRPADDLADNLGEEAVETMTSGEDEGTEKLDRFEDEEIGGPFVESTSGKEFAEGDDASNPADATREPFPKT